MKSYLFTLLTFFVCSSSFAQNETAWTLEQCLKWAATNNIQIKQAELSAKIAMNTLMQSKLNLLPTISGDGSYGFNFGNSINPTTYSFSQTNSQSASMGLSGNLPLFTGLQQLHNIGKSKADLEANKYDYENTINNTALNITNLFLQIVVNKELEKVSKKQIEISGEQLERAKKQALAGTLAEASIFELEAQKARDEASLTNSKNNVEINLLALKIALQIADKETFNIVVPDLKADNLQDLAKLSANGIYEYALNNQPSIKSSEARLKSAKYTEKIALGALSPTLSLGASVRSNYFSQNYKYGAVQYKFVDYGTPIFSTATGTPGVGDVVGYDRLAVSREQLGVTPFSDQLKDNLTKAVSINLNVPILSGWKRMTNIQNSKLQQQISTLNLEASKNTLRQDVLRAYTTAKSAADSYFANLKAFESSKKSFDAFEKRFNVGLSNNFELQQARTNLVRAESQMIQAKYSYLLDLKILDFYQGKPITLN